ncbi:EAL domain-containing protein [Erythrobacter sanguineus]|uniref:EAL domain, c-di-GMP-specific phosphodiesterase class I (Or its enzymatically inactive variant) n=1 Tax=Erythrobacter sanguineus TaxID=198312 RepID=A0A1M7RTN1_9SPHN|nr:EAL domain-containing protein [Erythrobacter sanguineus]SHN49645.1 EAL domain, c-di-GMP-specific phosphodiesterase class I (or its enzymatically inactive variant) [Erythrobacter sanguineus]
MISSLASLTAFLRRSFGFADVPSPVPGDPKSQQSGEALLRRKRTKVAILAILFGIISSAIELPLPVEDGFRAARAQLRLRPAPQDIVVVAIDDASLDELQVAIPSRFHDSAVIDRLIDAGAQKVVFDRAHADPETPAADAMFAQTLEAQRGKVWLGTTSPVDTMLQKSDGILPAPQFRSKANWAGMDGWGAPFALSSTFPTQIVVGGRDVPSISAVLSDYRGTPLARYRPDYAFRVETIPTARFSDVLHGRFDVDAFKGKNVVIGNTFVANPDFYNLPFYGKVPGVYFHVLGAHTLKRGTPVDLMWVPAILIAGIAIASLAWSRSRSPRPVWFAFFGLPGLALIFDELGVNIDIMSAMLALLGAGIGFRRLAQKYYSSEVNAMTTTALSLETANGEHDVYALKIASLAEMSEDWSARELGEFVNTLITYVKGPGEAGDVAFERDMLVWLGPRMDPVSLDRHADGLALMLKTIISHEWRSASSSAALGIDTNYALPLGQRIKKAMQAADEAANRGVRFIINNPAYLEARNHRIEIIRVLEKGLRERSIGVAYQPKVDLASGRIVGAETLIRWHAEGGGYVNPQELVLAAEANDRINELTIAVMETALAEGRHAIALDPQFKLAINMSAKSLSDTHLLFDMMTVLGRHGFPAENLMLELTETAKLEDARIAPQIEVLKQRGISLSIDDFGTGQSNLEYIEKLPSSELKIDKKFVQHMASSEESRAVVRATIEIAHSLGKVVVAEGVEDEAVAAALRAMGCDLAQGFLYAPAIPMSELLVMMGTSQIAINS